MKLLDYLLDITALLELEAQEALFPRWRSSSDVFCPRLVVSRIYSALRKYSPPLNFATFCHISGFKHKDTKLYFFVRNQQPVGHNHEVEQHLLDI